MVGNGYVRGAGGFALFVSLVTLAVQLLAVQAYLYRRRYGAGAVPPLARFSAQPRTSCVNIIFLNLWGGILGTSASFIHATKVAYGHSSKLVMAFTALSVAGYVLFLLSCYDDCNIRYVRQSQSRRSAGVCILVEPCDYAWLT